MNLRKSLILAAFTISAGTSHAWNLVYAHDANGNPTAGSLQTLRTALNNGSSLKVQHIAPNVRNYTIYCTQYSVNADASQSVMCLSGTGLGIDVRPGATFAAVVLPSNSVHYAANTLGQFVETNISNNNGAVLNRAVSNAAMQWFID